MIARSVSVKQLVMPHTMQLSDFERLVLSMIIENDPEQATLSAQLAAATVENRDYTGVGVYTKLFVLPDTPRLQKLNRYIEQVPNVHLAHPSLASGAGALLWMSDGFITCLECYAYDGEWPHDETLFSVAR